MRTYRITLDIIVDDGYDPATWHWGSLLDFAPNKSVIVTDSKLIRKDQTYDGTCDLEGAEDELQAQAALRALDQQQHTDTAESEHCDSTFADQ